MVNSIKMGEKHDDAVAHCLNACHKGKGLRSFYIRRLFGQNKTLKMCLKLVHVILLKLYVLL